MEPEGASDPGLVGPFVGCREAAARLGLMSAEAVRLRIERGTLPARRARAGYNAPWEIPVSALGDVPTSSPPEQTTVHAADLGQAFRRIHALEDVIVMLRAADEHSRRAAELQRSAAEEMARANAILTDALAASVMPDAAPSSRGEEG